MTSLMNTTPPRFEDIVAAAGRLEGYAVRTPLLEAPLLNAKLGGRLLVKPEMLQKTGSFKFRGAFNRLSLIPEGQRAAGVVAYSSGNHAQGVACAAAMLGLKATIIMPADAPAIKIANTRAYGAEVITYDRFGESREEIGARIATERGATIVRPYDDAGVIAGQGTIGLEIAAQAAELGATLDAVLVCCGGGGLVSGTALALSQRAPGVPVYAVEPAGFDDTARSLESGSRIANDMSNRSICDALLAEKPGEITFALNSVLLKGGLVVSDAEAQIGMATAFRYLKLVAEPGGAVALAAAITGKIDLTGKTVAVVCSGGNVDQATFEAALKAAGEV
ncbi:MAG: threonine/serine dehydratase [Alphaproteobacteria bacterium]|nr:threonine/serine dehydratase [Alphaproteobacteria bacterium]MBU0797577.1 threonine/serine dehydratase [Alphaproteobacteria bacterium]MBU0885641.1 threonine/serine dehydratase [Alphaproteobacteria bacterium]MBU1812703.1 threonine/serine dehydratase [Alphaproteobacteria bacterium]